MKRFLLLALCALFACQAGARTLYVNARRPNNNGNGLSAKKAKKTIQAAINVAKAGDTILVLQGTYAAPLKTNNLRIRIKSKSGAASTTIAAKKWLDGYSLNLGKGTATEVTGFTVRPKFEKYTWDDDPDSGYYHVAGGVLGGTVSRCTFKSLGRTAPRATFSRTKLVDCLLDGCYTDTTGKAFVSSASFNRCKVVGTMVCGRAKCAPVVSSELGNCLFANGTGLSFKSCVLGNCTVADNGTVAMKGNKAYNTIFHKVAASQFKKSKKNTLKSCYRGDPRFVAPTIEVAENDAYDNYEYDWGIEDYRYYVTGSDYRLQAGSPCINKGTKVAAAKKLYGTKDLDGRKRVKGKSVDIGCYEY